MVECGSLENCCGGFPHREFKSHSHRQDYIDRVLQKISFRYDYYCMNSSFKPSTKSKCIILILSVSILLPGCCCFRERDTLYQVSSIDALLAGDYEGHLRLKELKQKGDLGIGTFAALDGEMIVLDGKFYQVNSEGKVNEAKDSMSTPFAAVTFFEADKKAILDNPLNLKELQAYLDSLIPSKNIFYAFKIRGYFGLVKARSVPRQNKPYPLLTEVVKNQPVFELRNCYGTMVGFRCPAYVKGVNVPGYHFHFLTDDRKAGGHILGLQVEKAAVEIDYTHHIFVSLPESEDFYKLELGQDKQAELVKVEK